MTVVGLNVKCNVRFKNINPLVKQGIREQLAGLCQEHFEKYASNSNIPPVLYVNLASEPHRDCFRVGMRLNLGSQNMVVSEEDEDLTAGLISAAEVLEWRLRRNVAKQDERRRDSNRTARKRWQEFEVAFVKYPLRSRQLFTNIVLPWLAGLTDFVQRELAYLQAEDRIAHGYPSATDVIDEVLVHALESADIDALGEMVTPWLHGLVVDVLARYVAEHRSQQLESARLDEPVSNTSLDIEPADDDWLGEKLRLEELLPAKDGANPLDVINFAETQRQALTQLRNLPTRWRRVISLCYLDDMPIETIAVNLNMGRDEVRAIAEAGLEFLREQLLEQGYAPPALGWPADYLVAPPPSAESVHIVSELTALLDSTSG